MAKKLAKKKSVTIKPRKKVKVPFGKKIGPIKKSFTKTETIKSVMELTGLAKKQVVDCFEALHTIIYAHAKASHSFSLPGVFKLTVNKKPATKSRKGINPFTGEPTVFKAKPARKVIKIKPLKKLKETV